jgi:hypothetical protein
MLVVSASAMLFSSTKLTLKMQSNPKIYTYRDSVIKILKMVTNLAYLLCSINLKRTLGAEGDFQPG